MKNVYNLSRPAHSAAAPPTGGNYAAPVVVKSQPANSVVHQKEWRVPPRYEVRSPIGTGSYGHVCEAWDREEKRPVAIKKIHRVFEDLVDCKRILREIALLNRMNHNNIVKVLDLVCPEDPSNFDDIYLVLEIADSDFKKLCRTPVFLSELHIKTLLYNLLVGLKYLHSAGIYHRDLKPANCLVNQDCSVKICDFGLARTVNRDPQLPASPRQNDEGKQSAPNSGSSTVSTSRSSASTETSSASASVPESSKTHPQQLTSHVVTRWYRAPELILLQEHYTAAIDTWSVGCIFAELMNMIKENCPHPSDRGPLFPGVSCFPLSPDQKHASDYKFHTRGNRDQLNVIFNVIGTPSEEDIELLEKEDAKRYVRIFSERQGVDLANRFPASSPDSLDLLRRMLVFNAAKRISVDEALAHPFFKNVRDPACETTAPSKITVPFDDWTSMEKDQLRYSFLKETQHFHRDLTIPEHLVKAGYGHHSNNTSQ